MPLPPYPNTGALHDAIAASVSSTAYGPEVYNNDIGFETEYEEVLYCGVSRHYVEIVKDGVQNNTFVGDSMDAMTPLDDIPGLADENMLSVTIALTSEDVESIITAWEEIVDDA